MNKGVEVALLVILLLLTVLSFVFFKSKTVGILVSIGCLVILAACASMKHKRHHMIVLKPIEVAVKPIEVDVKPKKIESDSVDDTPTAPVYDGRDFDVFDERLHSY